MAGQPFESRTSVITCDTQGIVQEYAADAADLFGWTQDEVIGKMSVAMFHVPKNVPTLVPRLLREAVEKGKFEEEVTLMRKDGSTFRAILTVRPIVREGQHLGFMGMTHPLTPPGPVPVARLWVQAFRAPFLVASLIPGLVGALAARQAGYRINLGLLGLSLLGLVCIHLGTNMSNDAWDYRSGNDLQVRHLNPFAGGGRVLFRGVLNLRTHLAVAVTFLLLGSLIGLYLVSIVGLPLLRLWLLVVRLGVARATTAFGAIVLAAYAILVVGVVLFSLTPWALLALLAIPLAIKPILGLRRAGADPHALIPSNAGMIVATVVTGILLLAGLAIETFV